MLKFLTHLDIHYNFHIFTSPNISFLNVPENMNSIWQKKSSNTNFE